MANSALILPISDYTNLTYSHKKSSDKGNENNGPGTADVAGLQVSDGDVSSVFPS
jgi:hypothetical protein